MNRPIIVLAGGLSLCFLLTPVSTFAQGWNVDMLGNTFHEWSENTSIEISDNYAYVAAGTPGLAIVDISDPCNPVEVNFCKTDHDFEKMVVSGDYLYATAYYTWGGLRVYDITNQTEPVEIGNYGSGYDYDMYGLAVSGDYAYVSCYYYDVHHFLVIDISHPNNPQCVSALELDGWVGDVELSGDYAYIAGGYEGLYVINVSDPRQPRLVGRCENGENTVGLALLGDIACVSFPEGLSTMDISDPTNPTLLGTCYGAESTIYLCLYDNYLYSGNGNGGLVIFDVSDPNNPVISSIFEIEGFCRGGDIADDYFFLSNGGHDVLLVFDITSPANPVQAGSYAPGWAKDVAVEGQFAYIAAAYGGLKVVDISDYTNPRDVGFYMISGFAEGIDVVDTIAFIAAKEGGLRLIDVSDPSTPNEVGVFEDWTHIYDVKVIGNLAYAASSGAGVTIIDVEDPYNPSLVGITYLSFDARGIDVEGDYAYVAVYNETMPIFDISVPSNPTMVGIYYGTPYYHGYNVDVCGNYAYFCIGGGGFHIVDISDPVHPELISEWDGGNNVADIIVEEDYVYIACSLWGIKIVNVSIPANPYEVGKYVTRGQGAQGIDAIGEYTFLPDDEFFHIFNCSAAIGNVDPLELSIEPYNPPIIIPVSGGEFQFGIEAGNPNIVSVWFDLWAQIELPIGGTVESINIENYMLESEHSNIWHYEQSIPFNAPPGIYTFYAYIGEYPWEVAVYDSFTFEKEGAEGVDYTANSGDWPCREISDFDMFETVSTPNMDKQLIKSSPNPFNAATMIHFDLEQASKISLSVYDVSGRLVTKLIDGYCEAGYHEAMFDASDLASGVYIYQIMADDFTVCGKMVLMK